MILKNFRLKKGLFLDEFPSISLIKSDYVMTELPICEIEMEDDEEEVLYIVDFNQLRGISRATSKDKLQQILSKTKIFHFKSLNDDSSQAGKVIEVSKEEAQVSIRLPLDTPIDKLFLMNGEVMMLDNEVEISEGETK